MNTLRSDVDRLMVLVAELEKLIALHLQMRDRAAEVANLNLERRLDSMNAFREQLNVQSRNFITRAEHDFIAAQIDALSVRVTALETRFWLGGSGIVLIMTILQLVLNWRLT